MEVTKNKDINIGYLINERKLIELDTLLKQISADIEYRVSCVDGTSLTFNELNELINYPNRKEKQYSQISISNRYNSPIRISLTLSNRQFTTITYRVNGDEREVDYYAGKIEEFIMSLKQWYSFLATPNFFVHVSVSMLVSFAILLLLISFGILTTKSSVYIVVPLMIGISFIYDKFRQYLFPVVSFALGDGIERVNFRNTVRAVVLGAILLAGLVGYLVNQIPSITGQ
ncbi:hypothetical protein [Peribacillus simplex]|uniref:hypothetical protein n=1 Tax=Peribacillus simplex TaxID=1478 RepID=UPI003D01B088